MPALPILLIIITMIRLMTIIADSSNIIIKYQSPALQGQGHMTITVMVTMIISPAKRSAREPDD